MVTHRFVNMRHLCQRTVALNRPGVPLYGVTCKPAYLGRVPCTGPLRCTMCGRAL
jgi:hypothetical protein